MGIMAARSVIDALSGRIPENVVNQELVNLKPPEQNKI